MKHNVTVEEETQHPQPLGVKFRPYLNLMPLLRKFQLEPEVSKTAQVRLQLRQEERELASANQDHRVMKIAAGTLQNPKHRKHRS